jgi:hypothetical protein
VIADVINCAIAGIDFIHAVGRVVVRNGFAAGMNIVMTQNGITRLQTAHHGSTSPRFASTQRNHGSPLISTDFCNKICHFRTHAPQQVEPIRSVRRRGQAAAAGVV